MVFGNYSKEHLRQYLAKIQPYAISKLSKKGEFVALEYTLEIQHEGRPLFKFEYPKITVIAEKGEQEECFNILDRSGIIPLQVEFFPTGTDLDVSKGYIEKNGQTVSLTHGSQDLMTWIETIASLQGAIIFVPDTNFIKRNYYSSLFNGVKFTKKEGPFIRLSRLTLMEIENQYNRASKKAKSLSAMKPPLKPPEQQEKMDALKEIRLAFGATSEILQMQKAGVAVLPQVDYSLLSSFTEKPQSEFADPLIRREISDYQRMQHVKIFFMTSDMMNAMAALAEGFHALYFSRLIEDTYHVIENVELPLAELITNTAIAYEECDCILKIAGETKKFKIRGMWKGKGLVEWMKGRLTREGDESSLLNY